MGSSSTALFSVPLLWALLAPSIAVLARCRVRVVIAVVLTPLAIVLLATLISAPTGWGHAQDLGSDDFTNTGALVYLIVFTLLADAAGLALAAALVGGSRFVRSRAARGHVS
jgi:hypothetical protein